MDCRKKQRRREIVDKYDVRPLAHVKLLFGQEKLSCTGILLTDEYYCFSLKSKQGNEECTILCGHHAAKDFLCLVNAPPLPLFDPLVHIGVGGGDNGPGLRGIGNRPWNPAARQLLDAINLLVVCWNTIPGSALSNVKNRKVPLQATVRLRS